MIFLEGAPAFNECVFFHKASRTLIVTDLLFNFKNLPSNLKMLPFKMFGTFNRPACSRLLKLFTRDKKLFKKNAARIFEWDFDKIAMAHGEVIESNAKDILKAALAERDLI